MCLTRARSPDIADELSWHLPFLWLCYTQEKPSQPICQIPGTFFTLHHKKPNPSVCRGDLPLLALVLMAKTHSRNPVGLGKQILPFPVQPSFFNSHQEGAEQFRAALVPAPRVSGFCLLQAISSLLLAVSSTECNTLMLQQAPNFRIWSPETQGIPCPVLQSSFISVSDYSYSFHRLFLLSCSQPMSEVTLLPSMSCDTSKSCLNLPADNKWALNPKNRNTQTSSLKHEAFLAILTDRQLKITKHWKHASFHTDSDGDHQVHIKQLPRPQAKSLEVITVCSKAAKYVLHIPLISKVMIN